MFIKFLAFCMVCFTGGFITFFIADYLPEYNNIIWNNNGFMVGTLWCYIFREELRI